MRDPYPILPIKLDTEAPENLGTKEKFWVKHNGKLHLLKFGREGTGEDWAEKISCELCSHLNIEHANYELCTYNNRRAVLSQTIVESGERLIHGNEIINSARKDEFGARTYLEKQHTVSRVLAALYVIDRDKFRETWSKFIGYLILDALIGNTDRHEENWGLILKGKNRVILAPTFDHASSLGRELTDDRRLRMLSNNDPRTTVETYSRKSRSALFKDPSDAKPLSPLEAFSLAARAHPESATDWISKVEALSKETISDLVERVPSSVMSDTAKDFASSLLATNRANLINLRSSR